MSEVYGNRLSNHLFLVDCALFFWGLYSSLNWILMISGIGFVALSIFIFLNERTQFGRQGRPFFRTGTRSSKHHNYRLKLSKPELALHIAGWLPIFTGFIWFTNTNWSLVVVGILLIWTGQFSIAIGFSDSLSLAYEKLPKIGDEARGNGFIVRRIENGLPYKAGSHSL